MYLVHILSVPNFGLNIMMILGAYLFIVIFRFLKMPYFVSTGSPEWYKHDGKVQNGYMNGDAPAVRPNRLMSPCAEGYLDRNKNGTATTWFAPQQTGI